MENGQLYELTVFKYNFCKMLGESEPDYQTYIYSGIYIENMADL